MYVVTVTWRVKPGMIDAFMPLMLLQAKNSLEKEPDCHHFDVCQGEEDDHVVFLYEVYSDRAAFDLHLASAHFATFSQVVAEMVEDKVFATYHLAKGGELAS